MQKYFAVKESKFQGAPNLPRILMKAQKKIWAFFPKSNLSRCTSALMVIFKKVTYQKIHLSTSVSRYVSDGLLSKIDLSKSPIKLKVYLKSIFLILPRILGKS